MLVCGFPHLTNRKPVVMIKSPYTQENILSNWVKVQCGIPEGCILGLPLLFYINNTLLNIN
jgi:hypothetical protein